MRIIENGGLLGSLLVAWLILRTRAVGAFAARLFNGQHTNGSPKRDHAGEASVDFWRITFAEIVQDIFDRHERVEQERLRAIADAIASSDKGCSERHGELLRAIRDRH